MNTLLSSEQTWFKFSDCKVEDLIKIVSVETNKDDYPLACEIAKKVPIYDANQLNLDRCTKEQRLEIMKEWIKCLKSGPGIMAIRNLMDKDLSKKANQCFLEMIQNEKESGKSVGDHFGHNSRLWDSLGKMASHNPELFVKYYSNSTI